MKTITNKDYAEFIGKQESQFVINPSELINDVKSRLNGEEGTQGDLLPWGKTNNSIQLRPGEVSVWGGYNGHGKSQILGMAIAWLLKTSKCLIASMEMKPAATMERMVRQTSGTKEPSDNFIESFMHWTDEKLWIYDQTDTVSGERILGMIHYAASLGIKHIVIDSLMKCGFKGSSDSKFSQQVAFVDHLCWIAKTLNIHIHLVHHMRKGEFGEYNMPGKHDFRGAGELVDLVDNAFVVHRNKKKEDGLRKLYGQPESLELQNEREKLISQPDCKLGCVKQRHGEKEDLFQFWFHRDSMQYTADQNNKPLPYMFNVNEQQGEIR